jgi:predicted nucleic-acid-binding Zn-ribbon protein
MTKKFVCLKCGCHKVEGEIQAIVELKINESGEREIISMEYEFDYESGLTCSECGGNEIVEIGKRRVC